MLGSFFFVVVAVARLSSFYQTEAKNATGKMLFCFRADREREQNMMLMLPFCENKSPMPCPCIMDHGRRNRKYR